MTLRRRGVVGSLLFVLVACACGTVPRPVEKQAAATVLPTAFALTTPSPLLNSGQPAPRAGAAIEYDPVSGQLLLMGGMADPNAAGWATSGHDFWTWSPIRGWSHQTPSMMPMAGYLDAMVWDPGTRQVVLIPASGAGAWAWDGTAWKPSGPGVRSSGVTGAAYDAGDGVLLVLGRSAADGGETIWAWDGSRWAESRAPMSWREEGGVAYDLDRKQLVVYGGFGDADPQTWLWDGASWTSRRTDNYPTANQSAAVYDPVRHQVLMYGPGGETWTWDGLSWALRSTTGPGIRRDQSMAFDSGLGQVVLFGGKSPMQGGEDFRNDLWAWDGARWTQIG